MIDHQINLYKGIRQADNRLIRPRKNRQNGKVLDTMDQHAKNIFESLLVIINRFGKVENTLRSNLAEEAEAEEQEKSKQGNP